jgi:hypothetical protein
MHVTYLIVPSAKQPILGQSVIASKLQLTLSCRATWLHGYYPFLLSFRRKGGMMAAVTIKNTDKGRSTCAVVINPARQGQEHMCTGNHSCKKAFAQPATATHDSNSIGCNHCSLDCKTSLSATSAGASDAEHSYWNLGYKKTRSPSHTVAKVNHSLLAHDDKARTTSFAGSLQMLPSYILRGKHSLPQP